MLNTRDIQIIRSMPQSKDINKDIINFAIYLQDRNSNVERTMKAIKKGIKLGMKLPIYIHKPTKEESDMVSEVLDLQLNPERKEEWEKYTKEATEQEKANVTLLIFLDKLYL